MKIKVIGKYTDEIAAAIQKAGHTLSDSGTPDLIITHGGDGALLGAEREFPGIPKLPLRDRQTAPLCREHSTEKQLELFFEGKLKKSVLPKIQGVSGNTALIAINDVFVHNKNRISAVRYRVWIDEELYAEEIIGDGAGVATVHGSTAYYRSITHSIFRVGLGLAFSNSTELTDHLVLPESSIIKIQVTRGPAIMVADNSPEIIDIPENSIVTISHCNGKAVIYGLEVFMCQKCRLLRHSRKHRNLSQQQQ